jgi:hypothetical protein
MKNYILIKIPNTINWYSEDKTITDLMQSAKPLITTHTIDSLIRVGFQKSYQDDHRKYEGPLSVIVDLIRLKGIRISYWYDDLKDKGFGIISRNELVIDKRKFESIPSIFKDWLKPIIATEVRDKKLNELGIIK